MNKTKSKKSYYTIYNIEENTSIVVSSLNRTSEITGISRNRLWGYFSRGTKRNSVRLKFEEGPYIIIKSNMIEKQRRSGNLDAMNTKGTKDEHGLDWKVPVEI